MYPGITVGTYFKFSLGAVLFMMAGSQAVHLYYKPLDDLDKYIQKELDELPPDLRYKIASKISPKGKLNI